jgi:hypothetical protein
LKYIIFRNDNNLSEGRGECPLSGDVYSVEVTQEIYDGFAHCKYIGNPETKTVELNPDYETILLELEKENRKFEILAELERLDFKSIRALRIGEIDRLVELENEAQVLREELAELNMEEITNDT